MCLVQNFKELFPTLGCFKMSTFPDSVILHLETPAEMVENADKFCLLGFLSSYIAEKEMYKDRKIDK